MIVFQVSALGTTRQEAAMSIRLITYSIDLVTQPTIHCTPDEPYVLTLTWSNGAGDPDEWDRVMMVNLMSALRITRWLGPKMVEKEAGFIINIASIEATIGYPSAPTYSASKWGLRGWSKGIFEVADLPDLLLADQARTLLLLSTAS